MIWVFLIAYDLRVPDQSFTITRRNNATEKEGIQYMESLNEGFFSVDKDERKRILELLGQPRNYARSFDMIFIARLAGAALSLNTIETHIDEVTLIELKCTRAKLPNNPTGFFFGATQNEFDFGERLGDKFRFCFVCLNDETPSHALLSVGELEAIIRTRRIQYQINL
ncbi:MAG: hypothetical protein JO053_15290 [Acidobacteria bacterium]|nr:hypothetical protein [Acidobacteriota bacterium]